MWLLLWLQCGFKVCAADSLKYSTFLQTFLQAQDFFFLQRFTWLIWRQQLSHRKSETNRNAVAFLLVSWSFSTCSSVLQFVTDVLLQSNPSTVPDPPFLPPKVNYLTLLSCFSHPTRAAAPSLLARLPKHSLALTLRVPFPPTPSTNTVPPLASQGCVLNTKSGVPTSNP